MITQPSPSLPRTRSTRSRWEWITVLLAALGFLALGLYRLDAIGPYYDEWIFVPVSLRLLGECDIAAAVSFRLGCFPIMQAPPYVGAVKAWMSAPLFALFGVNAWSVRIVPIAVGLLTLLLLFRFARRELGALAAALLLLVCALDPALLSQVRFDWGPISLSLLFKVGGLAALWAWFQCGRPGSLYAALFCAALGYLDKLNFAWVLLAFGLAFPLAFADRLRQRVAAMQRGEWIALSVFALFALLITLRFALRASMMAMPSLDPTLSAGARALRLFDLFAETMTGEAVHNWIYQSPLASYVWPKLVVLGLLLSSGLVLIIQRTQVFKDTRLRLLLLLNIAFWLIAGQILLTRQVGGAHHMMALWPLHWLMLATLLSWAASRVARPVQIFLGGALLTIVLLPFAASALATHRAILRGVDGAQPIRPAFDPALYRVAEQLAERPDGLVISVDWGLHQGLLSLAPAARRPDYLDGWVVFDQPPADNLQRARLAMESRVPGKTLLLIRFTPNTGLHRAKHWRSYLQHWGAVVQRTTVVEGSDGEALVEIIEAKVR